MTKQRMSLLVLSLLALVLAACGSGGASFRGTVLDDPVVVPDFTLTDQYGQSFRLSEQQGKAVLLFFGYTSCPDVCPTTLASWRKVHEALDQDAGRVRFVFITVDPERDTPERLGLHVNAFNPDFVGLTGSEAELVPVYETFSIVRDKQVVPDSALGYLVNHTSSSFLLDSQGRWRVRESYGSLPEDVAHDIRLLFTP